MEENDTVNKKRTKITLDAKECHICRKTFIEKFEKYKNNRKSRGHYHYADKHRGAAHSIFNLWFNVPNEITVAFHNGLNYFYHFIIDELAK